MTTDRVNHINGALILMAAVAAFLAPFEVFLLSFAVLGPLHYLTEISWLYDRNCFLKNRRDYLPLLLLCAGVLIVPLMPWSFGRKSDAVTMLNYAAFAGAAVLVFARTPRAKAVAFAVIVLASPIVARSELCRTFFWPLLPTIIHVFVFTGAFILLGALRGRRKSALASMAILVMCSLGFFCVPMPPLHSVSNYVRESYAPFEHVNWIVMNTLSLAPTGSGDALYQSPQGLAVMRFIAFAYLHHYLNWFSKMSIIKWNRISTARAASIATLWIISLWIYAHHDGTRSVLLAALSYAHGFLELPLDHQTFRGLARELRALMSGRITHLDSGAMNTEPV